MPSTNIKCRRESVRKWRLKNKLRVKEYNHRYRLNNLDQIKDNFKEWTKNNYAHRREYGNKRRRIVAKEQRQELETHLGGKCAKCGKTINLDFHHRDPSIKSFTIAEYLGKYTIDILLVESNKCELLCGGKGGCHKILHRNQRGN